jgi:hypothetical protein
LGDGMGLLGGKEGSSSSSHAVSFLLGAALPTVLLFFLASDRLGQQGLSSISGSWGNGTILRPAAGGTELYCGRQLAGAVKRPLRSHPTSEMLLLKIIKRHAL